MIGLARSPFGLALSQLRVGQLYVKCPDDSVDFDDIAVLQERDRSAHGRFRPAMAGAQPPSDKSPSAPPPAAPGPTWPMQTPRVAPENRPSVMSAILPPMPCPVSAAVVESISRMPGPPRGPS